MLRYGDTLSQIANKPKNTPLQKWGDGLIGTIRNNKKIVSWSPWPNGRGIILVFENGTEESLERANSGRSSRSRR